MGYDQELFHRADTLIQRVYGAHSATAFLSRQTAREQSAAEALSDPKLKAFHAQRAAILTVATKLAAYERDCVLDELREELQSWPARNLASEASTLDGTQKSLGS